MSVRITANETAASITRVKPRMSVAVVRPNAAITASVPAASIEYIELSLAAYLDTTGRFKFIPEIVIILDALRINTSKALADSFTQMDVARKTPSKPFFEAVVLAEYFSKTLIYNRAFADTQSLSDAARRSVVKALVDQALTSDSARRNVTKLLTDSQAVADVAAKTPNKKLTDSVSFTDATTRAPSKTLTDSISLTDAASKSKSKLLTDSTTPTDDLSVAFEKLLADGVNIDDSASIGDGIEYYFSKFLNNTAFVSDSVVIDHGRTLVDDFTLADDGLLQMQDYCDITYFAEDYVGIARTF